VLCKAATWVDNAIEFMTMVISDNCTAQCTFRAVPRCDFGCFSCQTLSRAPDERRFMKSCRHRPFQDCFRAFSHAFVSVCHLFCL